VKRFLLSALVMMVFCLTLAGVTEADDIHLCATAAACTGNAGSVQFLSGTTTAYAYGKASPGDTLYIVVFTPVANLSGNWNNNSTPLWAVPSLNESPSQQYPTFSAAMCNLEGGAGCGTPTGFSAQSFNVQDYMIGTWGGAMDTSPASLTLPDSPAAGDMYMGFLEDSSGNLVAASPWSSSLLNVPEPSSLVLLGVGLLGLAGLAGRKLIAG
jgi:hypothetical protein